MSENISLAIQLMLVGMISVFSILGIVVLLGHVLINAVNKYAPHSQDKAEQVEGAISRQKLAVLSAAIEILTKGKGVVKSVKKL